MGFDLDRGLRSILLRLGFWQELRQRLYLLLSAAYDEDDE
jgi:hypothetical protein